MTREEIRVGCYKRAIEMNARLTRPNSVEWIAEQFSEFANELWKLQALDLAIAATNRRGNVEDCLVFAKIVSAFVNPEPPPVPVQDDRSPRRSKKTPRRR